MTYSMWGDDICICIPTAAVLLEAGVCLVEIQRAGALVLLTSASLANTLFQRRKSGGGRNVGYSGGAAAMAAMVQALIFLRTRGEKCNETPWGCDVTKISGGISISMLS
eukprot:scaffold111388_cov55-Cyclotella_meneghiniana.AAC.1